MSTPAAAERRLLLYGEHEAPDPTEASLRDAFVFLRLQLRPPFSLRTPSPSEYQQLVLAIAYGALTSPPRAALTHLVHLHSVVTDGYELFTRTLLRLSLESYPRLLQPARAQLLWVTSELIGADAVGVDRLVISLLRWVRIGDFSPPNLWLAEGLLRVLCIRWEWLLEEPLVLTSALFLYLRLLADHYRLPPDLKVEALKRVEIDFCVRVARQHFNLCMGIGRDLVRLLQDVTFIPEFKDLWKDLLSEPRVFGVCGYSDISQLYRTRTPVQYFLLGISPEMETRMRFLLTHVKFGSQRRYQEWFARKFLCRPECETIIVDLVRFVCCAHHPPNEILRSNIVPRWLIIGWLLKSCRKNYFAANAKLALFYDWLFFDEKVDSIMNIEPAILLMLHSIPEYVELTQELMEFLFLLIDYYDVDRKDLIIQGVLRSFEMLVKKGVVQSLDLLSTCSLISPLLKERLNVLMHASTPEAIKQVYLSTDVKALDVAKQSASCEESRFSLVKCLVDNLCATMTQSGSQSLLTLKMLLSTFATLDNQVIDKELGGKSSPIFEAISSQINESFKSVGYEIFSPLNSSLLHDDEILSATSMILQCYIFFPNEMMCQLISFWSKKGCPVGARMLSYVSRLDEEAGKYIKSRSNIVKENGSEKSVLQWHIDGCFDFGIHKIKDSAHGSSVATVKLELIKELVTEAFVAYKNFLMLSAMGKMSLSQRTQVENSSKNISHEGWKTTNETQSTSLLSDVVTCCNWNIKCRRSLFCGILHHLSDLSSGKEEFILLLVEQLDHVDILCIQFRTSLKDFSVFGKEPDLIIKLVRSSVKWEFMKQQKLWGLLVSELTVSNFKVERLLHDVSTGFTELYTHSIAIEGLYMLLRLHPPTAEIIDAVMSLPTTFQDFASAVLSTWGVSSNSSLFSKNLSEWLEKHEGAGAVSSLLGRVPGIRLNS